jgi:hypothetical protein
MHASHWFSLTDVSPQKAAMLLCRLNPHDNPDPLAIFPDDDRSWPESYNLMLSLFEDVSEQNQKRRNLKEWTDIVEKRGMRYHSWVGDYLKAIEASGLKDDFQIDPVTKTRPLQRQRYQEQEILRIIRELGHNPQAIPMWKPRSPGLKAEVRRRMKVLQGATFNKAWERLRAQGEIKDKR